MTIEIPTKTALANNKEWSPIYGIFQWRELHPECILIGTSSPVQSVHCMLDAKATKHACVRACVRAHHNVYHGFLARSHRAHCQVQSCLLLGRICVYSPSSWSSEPLLGAGCSTAKEEEIQSSHSRLPATRLTGWCEADSVRVSMNSCAWLPSRQPL